MDKYDIELLKSTPSMLNGIAVEADSTIPVEALS